MTLERVEGQGAVAWSTFSMGADSASRERQADRATLQRLVSAAALQPEFGVRMQRLRRALAQR